MDKAESNEVLREMFHVINGMYTPEIVKFANGECGLKIKFVFTRHGKELLNDILRKHRLEMRKEDDFIIIYSKIQNPFE